MLSEIILSDPDVVSHRLNQLQLEATSLREAILQAHLHRSRLTSNHPRIFFGLEMWGWSVSSLREQLRPLGWVRNDIGNFPLTAHEALRVAIAVAAGDEGTGRPEAVPSNRSRKGKNTVDAIELNQQFDMFEEFLPRPDENLGGYKTWVLLHHTDPLKEEIRIELSLPSEIGEDGKISAWSERILLGNLPLDGNAIEIAPPSGPDVLIDIRRKA
jgi:hypothetical protein